MMTAALVAVVYNTLRMYRQAGKRYSRPKKNSRVSKKFEQLGFIEDGCGSCSNSLHFYKDLDKVQLCVWYGRKADINKAVFSFTEDGKNTILGKYIYRTWEELVAHIKENDF